MLIFDVKRNLAQAFAHQKKLMRNLKVQKGLLPRKLPILPLARKKQK